MAPNDEAEAVDEEDAFDFFRNIAAMAKARVASPVVPFPQAAERERPERGLCLKRQWMDLMLCGEKVIEIRSRRHSFAGDLVYFIETKTGFVRGTARFGAARHLTKIELQANAAALAATKYAEPFAWPILEITPLPEPHWIVSGKARFNMTGWLPRQRWEKFPADVDVLEPLWASPRAGAVAAEGPAFKRPLDVGDVGDSDDAAKQ